MGIKVGECIMVLWNFYFKKSSCFFCILLFQMKSLSLRRKLLDVD